MLPCLTIPAMADLLANAAGAVAVDTGLGHLAAALNVPTVSIYGSTNPAYTGALGRSVDSLGGTSFLARPVLIGPANTKAPQPCIPLVIVRSLQLESGKLFTKQCTSLPNSLSRTEPGAAGALLICSSLSMPPTLNTET